MHPKSKLMGSDQGSSCIRVICVILNLNTTFMIADFLKKIFGDKSTRDQKQYQPFVDQIIAFEKIYRDWETDRKSTRLNSSH